MNTAIDRKTIAWIKAEVEETLRDIQDLPDQYLDNPEDITPLLACQAPLHRVKGAVEIANIRGATLLTLEMERLTQALCEKRVKNIKDATEVLATSMLQLPGYLESLYYGQPDIPLILLPQLNDLRAAQERGLLTEGEFFSPDLSVHTPVDPHAECIVDGDLRTVARKMRPGYLQGLLAIIRAEENYFEGVDLLKLVLDNLRIASHTNPARQLWWISNGILDSLKDGGLEPSVTIKILLGRVDQQVKRVIDHGEIILEDDTTNKLKKNLLYYISQSRSETPQLITLKKTFGLDYPDDNEIQQARAELYGFNVNLIDNISIQVREELAKIRDALDIALHAEGGSTAGLEPITANIASVADALGMLGMTKMQSLIYDYRDYLLEKINNQEILDDEDFMGLAAAVLHIETSLDTFGTVMDSAQPSDLQLPPAEYEKLMKLLAHEIVTEIKAVKIALGDYLQDNDRSEALQQCSALLANLVGAGEILEHDKQAHLFRASKDFIDHELLSKSPADATASLEWLADALVGVEYYYDSVLEKSLAPDLALEKAMQSLSQLGYPLQRSILDDATDLLEKNSQTTGFKCA